MTAWRSEVKPRLPRIVAIALIVWGLVAAVGSSAFAHAAYKFSSPDDESTVAQPPSEIWAEYTEPPSAASYLSVFDPCGEQVDNGDSRQEGYRVYVSATADKAGTYRVEWFVDSELDNHPTRGTFTFTSTGGEPCPGAEQSVKEDEPEDRRRDGSGRGRASDPQADANADVSEDSTVAAGEGTRSTRRERHHKKSGGSDDRDRKDRNETDVVAADDPSSGTSAPEEPGLLSDIPIGGLLIALAMVVAIGAAGGFIYAGIMGYHRISN